MRRNPRLALLLLPVAFACRSAPADKAVDTSAASEDVFLLTGELHAIEAVTISTPRVRGGGDMQIRWLAEDGRDVKAGDRLVDFDSSRVLEGLEEKRLRLRQAQNEREAKEHSLLAEADGKRAAVDKAEVEAEKAAIDAAVPRELRPAVEWRQVQATYMESRAALEKARLEAKAFDVSARADLEVARRAEEKARREVETTEGSLQGLSIVAPKDGIFLVGNYMRWGPDGPRKLQPGDAVWTGFTLASIPDPSRMDVEATLAEVDFGRVVPGMKARCILDTYPDRVFEGRVEDVGAVASGTASRFGIASRASGFPVRVSLATTDPVMRPGLSVRVEVLRGPAR